MKNDTVESVMKQLGLFNDIIGQDRAKRQITFLIDSYLSTRRFPNAMFNAAKGQGKTTIAKEVAKGLVKFDADGKIEIDPDKKKPRRKSFLEVNCSTIKNVKQFINSVIVKYVQDKDITILFDEASELPKDVTMALLTILNPSPEGRTEFSYDEYVCEFDFRRRTFLFATSEPQSVFHALLDRLYRIDLEDYTIEQMAQIVQKGAKEVKFKDNVLVGIAPVLRGNARAAQKMADHIKIYLKGRTEFAPKDWDAMKDIFGILPLGLNPKELHLLRLLADNPAGTPLTALSAKTGLSREALQRDYEMYLQKHGLMEISTTGRQITAKGLKYLRELLNPPAIVKQTFHSNRIVS